MHVVVTDHVEIAYQHPATGVRLEDWLHKKYPDYEAKWTEGDDKPNPDEVLKLRQVSTGRTFRIHRRARLMGYTHGSQFGWSQLSWMDFNFEVGNNTPFDKKDPETGQRHKEEVYEGVPNHPQHDGNSGVIQVGVMDARDAEEEKKLAEYRKEWIPVIAKAKEDCIKNKGCVYYYENGADDVILMWEIHGSWQCTHGRHRSTACEQLSLTWLRGQGFICASRPAHLFSGPHDDRGPCGCQDQTCQM